MPHFKIAVLALLSIQFVIATMFVICAGRLKITPPAYAPPSPADFPRVYRASTSALAVDYLLAGGFTVVGAVVILAQLAPFLLPDASWHGGASHPDWGLITLLILVMIPAVYTILSIRKLRITLNYDSIEKITIWGTRRLEKSDIEYRAHLRKIGWYLYPKNAQQKRFLITDVDMDLPFRQWMAEIPDRTFGAVKAEKKDGTS